MQRTQGTLHPVIVRQGVMQPGWVVITLQLGAQARSCQKIAKHFRIMFQSVFERSRYRFA
ncbi:hypothetical protein AS156_32600 [Bradyrhizobium macuxiense]|uniref:Uncharacterized protein n=1 Tax=Bradyrhizobium macuxiense TaxID=1755647 RepID=A0A120FQQ4_9BRAD|nr:hypothetical protein AS156_32600 [Bradyrhizobium macuxiense]